MYSGGRKKVARDYSESSSQKPALMRPEPRKPQGFSTALRAQLRIKWYSVWPAATPGWCHDAKSSVNQLRGREL